MSVRDSCSENDSEAASHQFSDSSARANCAEAFEARLWPELLAVVVGREGRGRLRESQPWKLRSRVDVHVRRNSGRVVKGPSTNKEDALAAVCTPDRRPAYRTAVDLLLLRSRAGHRNGFWLASE